VDELRKDNNNLREAMLLLKNNPNRNPSGSGLEKDKQDDSELNSLIKLDFKNNTNYKIDPESNMNKLAQMKINDPIHE